MLRVLNISKKTPTKHQLEATKQSTSLYTLTMAARVLLGLATSPAYASDNDEVNLQFGHYQEGERGISGLGSEKIKSKFHPIQSDNMHLSAKIMITDQVKGEINFSQDTWSGASPIATAPSSFFGNRDGVSGASPYIVGGLKLDSQLKPVLINQYGEVLGKSDKRLVHTLSGASPETRKQLDVKLSREWDEFTLDLGSGLSEENDYKSQFANMAGHWEFNQKLTSLSAGLSFTTSTTRAKLDHDATPYISGIYDLNGVNIYNKNNNSSQVKQIQDGGKVLQGNREDWGTNVGVAQVMDENTQIEASLGYTHSTGYMANPYKVVEVAFVNPTQICCGTASGDSTALYAYDADVRALLEQRPDVRNQGTLNLRYAQHIKATNAALHLNYRYFQDDWGIKAHTFEAEWAQPLGNNWTITPRIRYYSQNAADFYTPYIVTNQAYASPLMDPNGRGQVFYDASNPAGQVFFEDSPGSGTFSYADGTPIHQTIIDNGNVTPKFTSLNRKKLPTHYSSDYRLSGYGALSGGITVNKQLSKVLSLEVGYEYYKHAGGLKFGGGGESSYANFNYSTLNAALKFDLSATGSFSGGSDNNYSDSHTHYDASNHNQHTSYTPAGLMFDHMLSHTGNFMIGYRYMYSHQAGNMRHGSNVANNQAILLHGCNGNDCYVKPTNMNMHMHMLDIMYAPTEWLNLMIMPQYIDMNMTMSPPNGAPLSPDGMGPIGSAIMHADHPHTTGGIGDTGLYAMFKLIEDSNQHLHATLGLSVPTGDTNIKLRDVMQQQLGFIHYDMQLGSGTWDFKPSITYTNEMNNWSSGVQLSGVKRLESKNSMGYSLGDEIQSTAWFSRKIVNNLSASIRGVYTWQGAIDGEYSSHIPVKIGPMDYTNNYGGHFLDVGLGLTAVMHGGSFDGNKLSFEWLQPIKSNINGYQLERKGALAASWSMMF